MASVRNIIIVALFACGCLAQAVEAGRPPVKPAKCKTDFDCADTDYCRKLPGDCNGVGRCVPISDGCLAPVFAPVCGCDGWTYDHECLAAVAGASIAYWGKCLSSDDLDPLEDETERRGKGKPFSDLVDLGDDNDTVGCDNDDECLKGEECIQNECRKIKPKLRRAKGKPFSDLVGLGDDNDTVGCDNDDECLKGEECIQNECRKIKPKLRRANGKPVSDIAGEGCFGDYDCRKREFCLFPQGTCDEDGPGACVRIPNGCPDNYDPVCGCDGITYGNECEADSAGMSVDYEGQCGSIDDADSISIDGR